MDKIKYYLYLFNNYALILILIIIGLLFFINKYVKEKEGFGLINDTCDIVTNDNFNKKILFISGNYNNYSSIYDKFYSFYFDDIYFNNNIYLEQGEILKELLVPNNLHSQTILIDNILTGHLFGIISNFPSKITTLNLNNYFVNKCKLNYPMIENHKLNVLNDTIHTKFTCITNFSSNIFYFDITSLNLYFNKINNILVPKGFLVLNFINNFNSIYLLNGHINENVKNHFFLNYNYKCKNIDNNDNVKIIESITPKLYKNKERKNIHIINKYSKIDIIDIAKQNYFTLYKIYEKSKYKKSYGYIIFQKIN